MAFVVCATSPVWGWTKLYLKVQAPPTVEPTFYQHAHSPLAVAARVLHHDHGPAALLLEDVQAPRLSDLSLTESTRLMLVDDIITQIAQIAGDLPTLGDIRTSAQWLAHGQAITEDLRALVAGGSFQQVHATMIDQVKSDLEAVDITLGDGKLLLFDPASYDVKVKSYNTYDYTYVGKDLIVTNFMMKVDITWESTMGFAVCGIIFRGDKDIQNGSYYIFQAMRFSGVPAFDIEYFENVRFNYNLLGKVKFNSIIDLKNGATNSYILVIDKGTFFIYANGKRIAGADATKLSKGILAYYAWQESGETTCSFSKAWVWALP